MRRFESVLTIVFAVSAIMTALHTPSWAQKPTIEDLAKKMPGSMNALMLVNVDRIRSSEIATKESWFKTAAGKLESGMSFIPDGTDLVLLSAQMDYQTFDAIWTNALMTMPQVPPIDIIRQVTNGTVDEIAGTQVIETPSDRFVVQLDDYTIGAMHPADRQNFTRWFTTVKRGEATRVPGYLEEGLGYAEQLGTELIMAFNLDHVVSRTRVMERIRGSELLRKHSLVDTEVAKLLASVRGLSFGATVRDQIYGSVKIDFNEDISSLKPITEQLVQDVMEITGAHIDEFDEWKPVIDGKQLSMQGPLSKASFRLIMSLMPSPEHEATTPVDTEAGSGPAAATKRYFDSVNRMFDDLRRKLTPGQPYTRNATWMRKSADKIDGLPLANVDEQMLDYGNFVSGTIRNQALGLIESRETTKQSINTLIASGARSGGGGGSRWGGGSGRYGYNRIGRRGGWGYRRGGDGSRLRNATRSNIQSAAIESVAEVFTDIETTRGQVRQSMSAKYGMDF